MKKRFNIFSILKNIGKDKIKICIGLSNPKSPDNVNSVRRAAGNYGVDSIYYTGSRYLRALQYNPATVNISRDISRDIPVVGITNFLDELPKTISGKIIRRQLRSGQQ